MGFLNLLKRRKILSGSIALVAVLVVLIAIFATGGRETEPEGSLSRVPRSVEVSPVGVLGSSVEPLPLLGQVRSTAEADLRAEASGDVIAVYKNVGDFVSAGSIIAEIENAAERASVLQAQGAVAAAQAALPDNEEFGAEQNLLEAKIKAVNALNSAFNTAEQVVLTDVDRFFYDARSQFPRLKISNASSNEVEDLRVEIREPIRYSWNKEVNEATIDSDLRSLLDNAEYNLNLISDLVDEIASIAGSRSPGRDLTQAEIDSDNSIIRSAQTKIDGALSAVSGARLGLSSSATSLGAADASLIQAEGLLAAAQANLERKIVRTPISGVVSRLSVRRGDFANIFDDVALVSNEGALEVLTYVTETDAERVSVGGEALIDGDLQGVVTSVASALDPRTKKIEVRIGVLEENPGLVNGESVRVFLSRARGLSGVETDGIPIPVSALKVGTDGVVVFTVSDEGTLVGNDVVLGPILGDKIIVREGLTPEMVIVVDARGLREGEKVTVLP